ncbi:MAG TPA: hypothetical protein VML75_06220, partial [Kofleriaceae bacterium]|nr:hypothetical protein [Kofleriaceae bacterium]
GLRCGSVVTEPGGLKDDIVHVWRHHGQTVLVMNPEAMDDCHAIVARSTFPPERLPSDPVGRWECRIETSDRQLVGLRRFEVVAGPTGATPVDAPGADARPPAVAPAPSDAERGEDR